MTLVVIIVAVYALFKICTSASSRKVNVKQTADTERIKLEQARMREEWKQRVAEAKIETDRLIKLEREQQRQAEQLAKHEERLEKLEYRLSAAEADIEHWSEQIGNLYALLDIEMAEQAGAVPGSKTDIKCQKRIIALNNQIHTAESRVRKAQFEKSFCEKRVEVA